MEFDEKNPYGSVLDKAKEEINSGRLIAYGKPEDSLDNIAGLWNWWLYSRGLLNPDRTEDIQATDVAAMMALLKIARGMRGRTFDNIRDACGYLGLFTDLCTIEYGKDSEE